MKEYLVCHINKWACYERNESQGQGQLAYKIWKEDLVCLSTILTYPWNNFKHMANGLKRSMQ